jgi:hypothetical protein
MVIVFIVLNFDISCRLHGLWNKYPIKKCVCAPHNIECYKCHNYGHIFCHCKSMMDNYMKENTDIKYKKVWKRKQEHVKEDQMNQGNLEDIL